MIRRCFSEDTWYFYYEYTLKRYRFRIQPPYFPARTEKMRERVRYGSYSYHTLVYGSYFWYLFRHREWFIWIPCFCSQRTAHTSGARLCVTSHQSVRRSSNAMEGEKQHDNILLYCTISYHTKWEKREAILLPQQTDKAALFFLVPQKQHFETVTNHTPLPLITFIWYQTSLTRWVSVFLLESFYSIRPVRCWRRVPRNGRLLRPRLKILGYLLLRLDGEMKGGVVYPCLSRSVARFVGRNL